jgi:hypothetical protein
MANEQNTPVRPSKAPLHLRDKDGEKACDAVMQGVHVLALAGGVPQRRPRVIDLGEVSLEGVRGRWAGMETRPGFDGRVPLRYACVERYSRVCENRIETKGGLAFAHRVRHISAIPTQSTSVWTFASSDLAGQMSLKGYIDGIQACISQ